MIDGNSFAYGGYDARYYACAWATVLAAQLRKREERDSRMREIIALGALAAGRFPAPDPTAFPRQLGITR
ncbi:hypothetical protein [Nocardia sp. NRRL S-836]|uniref:hypothetical protein n=1 Tax=Nocardia sp. NRRL S-836 TaxID=1519492 RepID=UPI0006AE5B83|nr:hypothetical protein [Nocardia sp. NRRL S-836]KOV83103.1 hypothetical protein ADL03_21230 [Nocardia sp. NRRL S-836]